MNKATQHRFRTPKADRSPRALARRSESYRRRLKAAGIDPDAMPEDIDEFRGELARMIAMFIDEWHGCPEPLCQRNRGCMAPNIHCSNVEPLSPEELERDWPRVQAEVYKALKEHLAPYRDQDW